MPLFFFLLLPAVPLVWLSTLAVADFAFANLATTRTLVPVRGSARMYVCIEVCTQVWKMGGRETKKWGGEMPGAAEGVN